MRQHSSENRTLLAAAVIAALGLSVNCVPVRAQTQTSLFPQTSLPDSWGVFVPGTTVANITVQNYTTPGGAILVDNQHILDTDPDPNEKDPLVNGKEDIGIQTMQYISWTGSTG